MLSRRLFARAGEASGPRGHRAYAVGDVHGRLDLLDDLLERIEDDCRGRPSVRTSIVFLGDLIDRGPDSAGVIERLRTFRPAYATPYFIMGNHEEVLLRIVDGDIDVLADWLAYGGAECARSYGLDPVRLREVGADEAVTRIGRAIPPEHVEFLRGFVDTVTFGTYLLVHAGIRPGVPLAAQVQRDLRWIRHPFLSEDAHPGFVVVHGHTISEEVEIRPNRIGIDTGAYRTGALTAAVLEASGRRFLQTGRAS